MSRYVVLILPRTSKPIFCGCEHFSFSILSEVLKKEARRNSIKDCYKDNILNLEAVTTVTIWPVEIIF